MHTWTWFAVAGVSAVIEVLSLALVFASFAIGAVAAGLVSLAGGNSAAQWITLALATVLSLLLRPLVVKSIFRKTPPTDTGINALIGQKAITTSEVSDTAGTIMLKNETWTARSAATVISAGQSVTVERIDGAMAIVVPRIDSHINEGA